MLSSFQPTRTSARPVWLGSQSWLSWYGYGSSDVVVWQRILGWIPISQWFDTFSLLAVRFYSWSRQGSAFSLLCTPTPSWWSSVLRRGIRVMGGGLINTGRATMSFLIWVNMWSNVSSHMKVFGPFNSLKNGFAFSANFGRKRENAANLSFNCCTSFRQVGLLMLNMASHLSKFASMPL